MPYIYKITNDINDKIYIGKTLNTISTHISEVCRGKRKTAAKFIWKIVD